MLNLYPSEEQAISRTVEQEVSRFRNERSTKLSAAEDFAKRLTDKLHQLGFVAIVNVDPFDPKNYELADDDTLIFAPAIDIVSRTEDSTKSSVDFDKMQYEVKKKAGYEISPDGTKKRFE